MSETEETGRPKRARSSGSLPSLELRQRGSEVLPEVDRRLRKAYRTATLGNKPDPLDELIYIQLSIRTREGTYSDTFSALQRAVDGDWAELLRISEEAAMSHLRTGGMAAVKLDRLRAQIADIKKAFGAVTLDALRSFSDHDAESFLRSLPGVGPKAARCVLMYSLGRKVFPVDSHCRRVLDRLGFLPGNIDRKAANDFLQELVPRAIRHTLHVNLVHHGRALCVPLSPRCERCPILDLCPTGRLRLGRSLS